MNRSIAIAVVAWLMLASAGCGSDDSRADVPSGAREAEQAAPAPAGGPASPATQGETKRMTVSAKRVIHGPHRALELSPEQREQIEMLIRQLDTASASAATQPEADHGLTIEYLARYLNKDGGRAGDLADAWTHTGRPVTVMDDRWHSWGDGAEFAIRILFRYEQPPTHLFAVSIIGPDGKDWADASCGSSLLFSPTRLNAAAWFFPQGTELPAHVDLHVKHSRADWKTVGSFSAAKPEDGDLPPWLRVASVTEVADALHQQLEVQLVVDREALAAQQFKLVASVRNERVDHAFTTDTKPLNDRVKVVFNDIRVSDQPTFEVLAVPTRTAVFSNVRFIPPTPATQPDISPARQSATQPAAGDGAAAKDTLQGVTYVDMFAPGYRTARPLLCGPGRYWPGGAEMVFRGPETSTEFHVVFAQGVAAPRENELAKPLTLHGRFGTIRSTRDGKAIPEPDRKVKSPHHAPYDYPYFMVSSWQRYSPATQPDEQPAPAGGPATEASPATQPGEPKPIRVNFLGRVKSIELVNRGGPMPHTIRASLDVRFIATLDVLEADNEHTPIRKGQAIHFLIHSPVMTFNDAMPDCVGREYRLSAEWLPAEAMLLWMGRTPPAPAGGENTQPGASVPHGRAGFQPVER